MKKLGTGRLGFSLVDLFVDHNDCDSKFSIWPRPNANTMMVVGLRQTHWSRVLDGLLHETFELAMVQVGARFTPCPDMAQSHGGYVFVATHGVFEDAVSRSADFLANAIPAVAAEFHKRKKRVR